MRKQLAIAGIALFLLVSLAISIYSFPYSENVFDGYALERTAYKMTNNDNFTIEFGNENKAIFNFKDTTLIVDNGTCRQNDKYNICVKGYVFSHYNYSLPDRIVNKVSITIGFFIAKINFTRNITQDMSIGQDYRVKSAFQNTGDIAAEDVSFSDTYPAEFDVFLTSDCLLFQNTISWKGRLEPNENMQCSYILKPSKDAKYNSKAQVDYHDGLRKKKEETTAEITVTPYSLNITESITNKSPEIGEEIAVNFTLYALGNISVSDFLIKIPPELKIITSDNALARTENGLRFIGVMKQNDTIVFKNKMRAELSGNSMITVSARFTENSIMQKIEKTIPVSVLFKEPYVRLSRTEFNNNKGQFSVFAVNPSTHTVYDITLTVRGIVNGNHSETSISGLSHKEYIYEFEKENGEYNITTLLKYKSEFQQKFMEMKTEQINISSGKLEKKDEQAANITEQKNTSEQPENNNEQKIEVDLKKGVDQTKKLALIFGALILLVIILGTAAAKLKKRGIKEEKREVDLNELIGSQEKKE